MKTYDKIPSTSKICIQLFQNFYKKVLIKILIANLNSRILGSGDYTSSSSKNELLA